MREKLTVLLIVSTLFLKELWTLYPASTVEYRMFEYSDTPITKQTYIFFLWCYVIQLITVHSWYYKFDKYRLTFGIWFVLAGLEVIEYYFTYNEALYYLHFRQHYIGINVTNIKYVAVVCSAWFDLRKVHDP